MKFVSYLMCAFAAAVLMAPVEAASNARVSTTSDIRASVSEDLEYKYTVDSDGDVRIAFKDAPTIWVRFYNDGKRLRADDGPQTITRICIISHVKIYDDSEYNRCLEAANDFNLGYALKAYAQREGDKCAFVLERNEFVEGGYTRAQFAEVFDTFVSICVSLNKNRLDVSL